MDTEVWRPVVGFDGRYSVSSTGQVRSEPWSTEVADARGFVQRRHYSSRILAAPVTNHGYRVVSLRRDGRSEQRLLHVVIAEAFIGPRPDGWQVRHLDGDPMNNRAENLTYGTRSDNMQDCIAHGRNKELRKTHCKRGHPLVEPNLTEFGLRSGHRICKACGRGLNKARHDRLRLGLHRDIQEVSDHYFRLLWPADHGNKGIKEISA